MSTSSALAPPPTSTSSPPSSLSSSSVVVLADDRDILGEGPVHDPRVSKLYRVDIEGKKVLSIDLKKIAGGGKDGEKASASVVVGTTPEAVGCLCLTSDPNILLVALSRTVYSLDVSTGKLSDQPLDTLPESEGVEGLRFNDGKVSPKGFFVVGRLHAKWREGNKGAVYALKKKLKVADSSPSAPSDPSDWELERVLEAEEVGMGNGMAWRPKRLKKAEEEAEVFDFFVVDSAAKTVQRFATDPETAIPISGTGAIVLDGSDFGNATPDGMDVDSNGNLWVALAETGTVVCFDPDAKEKGMPIARLATLRLPLTRVTSAAFGAKNESGSSSEDFSSTLFVTSREEASKLKEEASPVAGSVLIVSDVAGAARVREGGKVSAGCLVPALVEL